MRKIIFVSSPYSGNVSQNRQDAIRYCKQVVDKGCIPFAPHLLFPQFLNEEEPQDRELGIEFGLTILRRCDEFWMFGNSTSAGMQRELDEAEWIGLPVRKIGGVNNHA